MVLSGRTYWHPDLWSEKNFQERRVCVEHESSDDMRQFEFIGVYHCLCQYVFNQ